MPITQILLASRTGGGAPLNPVWTLTPQANNVDEGGNIRFDIGGTDLGNFQNVTYYWTIESGSGEFNTTSGSVNVSTNASPYSYFIVYPNADATTEGAETFTVSLRSDSITGTVLATSSAVTINDTSLSAPTYTLANGGGNTVNEGSNHTLNVGGTNVPGGTYYWTIETNSGDFATTSGEVTVTGGTGSVLGSFTVTPTADATTEGTETFTVALRSGSISGTILATSQAANISDTSLDPVPPFSLEFTGAGTRRLAVQYFQSDWNLSTTWTLEWWSKATTPSTSLRTVMSQEPSAGSIDVYYENGNLRMSNGTLLWVEPPVGGVPFGDVSKINGNQGWGDDQIGILPTTGGTGSGLTVSVGDSGSNYSSIVINNPGSGYTTGDVITVTSVDESVSDSFTITATARGIWTHVAISSDAGLVKVYYNGIQQSSVQRNLALTDSTRDLYIGRRGNNNFQYFDGNLALIRISEVARYPTAFNSSISYGVDADTLLFLGTDNPLADLSTYQLNGVTTSANGGTTIYFAKSVYPNLDKQIQVGNTVVGGTPTTTATVTGAVFTPGGDPDNWGVLISTTMSALTTVNFSGIRHTVTNTGVVRTNDVPSAPKLRLATGTALVFNGTDNRRVVVEDNLSDWNLGDNWTIEWWQKIPAEASGFLAVLCQDSNVSPFTGIDIFINNGSIQMFNGAVQVSEAPATRGEWNHIAIQRNGTALAAYINGVSRTISGTGYPGTITPSSPLNIVIGSRTADGGATFWGQYFNGQLANIRISSVARYSTTFTPPLTVAIDADTKLALDGSTGGGGMLADELTRHTITNNGATVDTIS